MSVKKVGDILKVNIPEFIQGLKELDEYLEVGGEILDDAREGILALTDIKNYRKTDDEFVDVNLHELGFEIPVNVKLSVKRQVLRDLAQIHMRRGTEDGISHLMRIIGIESEINRGWLLNPRMATKGYHRDYFTREERRVDPNDRTYMDFLYGEVVEHPDGAFFEGYTYWDIKKEKKTGRIPIYGEVYKHVGTLGEDTVGSTPYITIRFDSEDIFLVDGTQSVDPVTGEVFEFSIGERFALLEDIIKFFLVGEFRPTTMRIIIESKLLDLDEGLYIAEQFRSSVVDTEPLNYSESVTVRDLYMTDGTVSDLEDVDMTIGANLLIGDPTPVGSRWWGASLIIGDQSEIPVVENWKALETDIHLDEYTNSINLPLLGVCDIDSIRLRNVTVIGVSEDGEELGPVSYGRIPQDVNSLRISTNETMRQTFKIRRYAR